MKNIHYDNSFSDISLKESAFILNEIEQYLSFNNWLIMTKRSNILMTELQLLILKWNPKLLF